MATATTPSRNAEPSDSSPLPDPDSGGQTRARTLVVAVVIASILFGLIAVTASRRGSESASNSPSDWRGTLLESPQDKPDLVLTDTSGKPFDLRADTEGQLTLLMFGYTNCPDICPISVATLASTLDSLEPSAAKSVRMVFVTADPQRDTEERLRAFLDQFDESFIGLTGTQEQIDAAQAAAKLPLATRDKPDDNGSYTVGHATQMIAYQADGTARIVYPFGTREADWARDLPRLVAGEVPEVQNR